MNSMLSTPTRCAFNLQRFFLPEVGHTLSRSFSTTKFDEYVGCPELPIPGSQSYEAWTQRLSDPRVLAMLSSTPSGGKTSLESQIQVLMQRIINQNAELLQKSDNLSKKIELLEGMLVRNK